MKTTPLFPDGSDFDNYVPGRITSDGFSTEYNAYTYSYSMHEVTVTASRYTWAEQWCRDYTWNRRGTYSSEYSGGEVYISPTTGSGGGGGGGIGMGANNQSGNSKLTPSVVNYPIVPELHKVYNTVFTYDGIVYPNPSKNIQVDAGQHVRVEIKNINEIGVVLSIQDATTYHYTKTLLGFSKVEYTGEGRSFVLLPGHTVSYSFYRFDYAPITWMFEISTISEAASVRIGFYSEWHSGMSPDPNHPKYKNRP